MATTDRVHESRPVLFRVDITSPSASPLIIHGGPTTGKSRLLARLGEQHPKLYQLGQQWQPGQATDTDDIIRLLAPDWFDKGTWLTATPEQHAAIHRLVFDWVAEHRPPLVFTNLWTPAAAVSMFRYPADITALSDARGGEIIPPTVAMRWFVSWMAGFPGHVPRLVIARADLFMSDYLRFEIKEA